MEVKTMKLEDVAGAASVHMEAFQDHMNVLFGYRYNFVFLKWFVNNEETIHLVGTDDDGLIAGYVVGATPGYQKGLTKSLIPFALLGFLQRPFLVFNPKIMKASWDRLKSYLNPTGKDKSQPENHDNGLISLVGICTLNAASGKGLASMLEREFIHQAKTRNFSAARLSVHSSNSRARRFYEKYGWEAGDDNGETITYFKRIQ